MTKSIYLLTTTPSSHTHRFHSLTLATPTSYTHTFHPLSTIVIHTLNLCKVKSMDDNCGEWVECMGVGVVSRRWVWLVGVVGIYGCMWLLGVVVRRYIDFLILLIPTLLVSVIFYSRIPTFCSFLMFFVLVHNSTCRTFACTDLRSLLSRPYVCALRIARYGMFHNNRVQSSSPVQQSNPVITDAHYIPKPPISTAVQSV